IQVGQPKFTALLTDLLRKADEHAEPGRIDIPCIPEIDQELALSRFEFVEHLLFQLLPITHNKLAIDIHHHHALFVRRMETHDPLACSVFAQNSAGRVRGKRYAIPVSPPFSPPPRPAPRPAPGCGGARCRTRMTTRPHPTRRFPSPATTTRTTCPRPE